MYRLRLTSGAAAALALSLCVLALSAPAAAQQSDFLFRTPRVTLGLRAGYAVPTASSEIFDFTTQELTVRRSDFGSAALGGQLAIRMTPRLDLALDVQYSQSRTPSEFRDWVDNNDLPIEQVTKFQRVPLTVGVKAYLKDRGRAVGHFAWIPTRWAPYVGASAGVVWYTFDQSGDFIDYETLDVFPDHFVSDGSAPTVHLVAGADWTLGPSFLLNVEGRYAWAKGDMSADFANFNRMDLSGFQATAGIAVRF